MPKSSPKKLAYQAEYQKSPAEVKKREARNQARYQALKAGLVHKGDHLEVDHKNPLGAGGSNAKGNTRVISEKRNAGWRKGESGYTPKKV
jgi:hypothetical protein